MNRLPVMEDFYTLQGEGAYQGHAAYFIRLGGCDVGCVWCDVKESWDKTMHPEKSIDELIEKINTSSAKIVVVTGGEPTLYNLSFWTTALQQRGYRTHLETAGTNDISGAWNWVCLSPKKFKEPVPSSYQKANELKVIVYNQHDLKWAEQEAAKVSPDCQLFLQPEWSKEKEMLPFIIEYVKARPRWALSLQLHKYIHVP